jgi:hypothetical protein
MSMWKRNEHDMTCLVCGAVYSYASEWDMANVDWHEHDKEGV